MIPGRFSYKLSLFAALLTTLAGVQTLRAEVVART
jgi:hypothetical protein